MAAGVDAATKPQHHRSSTVSSIVIRKKPKGPEDGEPNNQANCNTTTLQPLFLVVIRKKPKGSAIRTPRTVPSIFGHKQYFVSSDVGAGKMQWYAFHNEAPGGVDSPSGRITWGKGHVTLLGDYVHAMPPNMGQGGCMAIEDGYQLTMELNKAWQKSSESGTLFDINSSLRSYENSRRLPVAISHGMARMTANGFYLQGVSGCRTWSLAVVDKISDTTSGKSWWESFY
ncbi:hypothetical protein C1H46_015981 [Malus baccata]|uniref:FAD-binding domain-containing protein n=1 Tax=Malus baccata TaxID=106549 RepID=A0A540MHW9_MALBA|nr:hypothetical protein C1H46_015981 [Malus baccata]